MQRLHELGAQVEAVDPGISDPLHITIGLWFAGAWTLWNTLSAEQQARTDPDFRAEAELGSRYKRAGRAAPATGTGRTGQPPASVHAAL